VWRAPRYWLLRRVRLCHTRHAAVVIWCLDCGAWAAPGEQRWLGCLASQAEMMRTRAFEASEGVVDWLEILKRYQVPCCVCATTSFDQAAVTYLLSSSGLQPYFDVCVTAEDGCETTEQGYLVAAIKLRRPPMRCVVFEDEPRGVAAAHEATAKVVALMGSHSGGDLRHADMRVSALDDLSLMSLRELFKGLPPM
jgi:beta-phosphoglucomutase-like phosphatase (HAD superfamily)